MLLLSVLMLTSACQTTLSNGCPALKNYTAEEQDKIHIEMRTLSKNSELRTVLQDYENLRDQVRACRGS